MGPRSRRVGDDRGHKSNPGLHGAWGPCLPYHCTCHVMLRKAGGKRAEEALTSCLDQLGCKRGSTPAMCRWAARSRSTPGVGAWCREDTRQGESVTALTASPTSIAAVKLTV